MHQNSFYPLLSYYLLILNGMLYVEPEETGKSVSDQTGQLEELLTRLPTIMNRKFVDEVSGFMGLTMPIAFLIHWHCRMCMRYAVCH